MCGGNDCEDLRVKVLYGRLVWDGHTHGVGTAASHESEFLFFMVMVDTDREVSY